MTIATTALQVSGVSKTFGTTRVLSDLSLTIAPGEIVALIGENGSGKSTFIKVLSGYHEPDKGAVVRMGGTDISDELQGGPDKTGMGFIHQDLALVESMTIVENLRIGHFETGALGRIRWKREVATVRTLLARVGLDVDPRAQVGQLSVTDRALVAIARGLAEIELAGHDGGARLLVLDEPTAYLPASGVQRLFRAVSQLADEGVSILFISHRLDEVLEHCSRVLVLRAGVLVADDPTAGLTERDLVTLMLGRAPEDLYPDYDVSPRERVLQVEALTGGLVRGIDLDARAGEIVGFVGLPGSGYEELPYLLAGTSPASGGAITVAGSRLDARRNSPEAAIGAGVALLPADRKGASGAQSLSVSDNITIATLADVVRRGVISDRTEREIVAAQVERFRIALPSAQSAMATLSGGNQQKALLAKWVISSPKVFALHEPTQGVDVGAKREVFRHLTELARAGTLLLIASVEYEDLAHLCTRVHVMRHGRIIRTVERDDLTAHELAVAVHG